MHPVIRPARESDSDATARLAGELGYPTLAQEAVDRLRAVLGRLEDGAFVAEFEGAVVGWTHVFGANRLESGPFAEIAGLVVESSLRGRGVGRALVAAAEGWAAGHGYRHIRVRSNVTRIDAHRFYEDLGYDRIKAQAVFAKSIPATENSSIASHAVTAIGRVESPVKEMVDDNWGDVIARIVLLPAYQSGIQGLEQFSHVIVVTYLHRASFDPSIDLIRRPRGLAEMPEVGIFAQRAKNRPNPIGITAVRLLDAWAGSITVRGLDAVDGTPVLDIKPYFPHYDQVEAASAPAWVDQLMRGYF